MKNRIVGLIALIFGIGSLAATLAGAMQELGWKAWAATIVFTVIGSWQLLTGKSMSSLKDSILKGEWVAEKNNEKLEPSSKVQTTDNKNIEQDNHIEETMGNEFIVTIFLEEALECIPTRQQNLDNWLKNADKEGLTNLNQELNTTKGGSLLASIMPISEVASLLHELSHHLMENSITDITTANTFLAKGITLLAEQTYSLQRKEELITPSLFISELQSFLLKEE